MFLKTEQLIILFPRVDLRNCNISSANILQQNWTSDHGVYDKKKLLIM